MPSRALKSMFRDYNAKALWAEDACNIAKEFVRFSIGFNFFDESPFMGYLRGGMEGVEKARREHREKALELYRFKLTNNRHIINCENCLLTMYVHNLEGEV